MRNLKLLVKQVIFNFKFIISNKSQLLLSLIFPICGIIVPLIFFYFTVMFPIIMQYSVIAPAGIVFASTAIGIKKSTLYSNLNLTSPSNSIFYIGIYLTMLFIGSLFFAFTMIVLTILGQFHLLLTYYLEYDNSITYQFWNLPIGVVSLVVFQTITVLFALSFFLIRILNSQKTYYIILLILLLLCIVLGSNLNDYFIDYLTIFDEDHNIIKVLPFLSEDSLYPKWLFIPSLIFPFYAPSQLLSIVANQAIYPLQHSGTALIEPLHWLHKSDFYNVDWTTGPETDYENAMDTPWRYNLVLLNPLIQVVFYGSTGILISKILKNK